MGDRLAIRYVWCYVWSHGQAPTLRALRPSIRPAGAQARWRSSEAVLHQCVPCRSGEKERSRWLREGLPLMPDEPSTTAALPFSCCSHCACPNGERIGHDDTCSHGCNDNGENDEAPGKVWVVVEQEMYEIGPVRIVGVFSSEESAERASAENDGDRSVYVVELEP